MCRANKQIALDILQERPMPAQSSRMFRVFVLEIVATIEAKTWRTRDHQKWQVWDIMKKRGDGEKKGSLGAATKLFKK